ncbi:hypothetical protein PMAYCL1PPCAC_04694, partial [Pristionchus mayeri]
MDATLDGYVPILLINCRLIFSDSIFAAKVDIVPLMAIGVLCFGQSLICYFYCVYYRRSVVLPPGSRFCYTGWKKIVLFVCHQ